MSTDTPTARQKGHKSMTRTEKPIRVIPHKGRGHKIETHIFAREIRESYCAQPGCQFIGKHAVQGVCHTTEMFDGERDWFKRMELREAEHRAEMALTKKQFRGRPAAYLRHLEAMYECAMLNWAGVMDELIALRRDNALLRASAGRKGKRRG